MYVGGKKESRIARADQGARSNSLGRLVLQPFVTTIKVEEEGKPSYKDLY